MLKRIMLALVASTVGLSSAVAADDWKPLLTDDEMSEWQTANGAGAFRADKGTLTVDGPGQIVYRPANRPLDLKDLELQAEVMTQPGGRAGLAFHFTARDPRSSSGIEVRFDNSYSRSETNAGLLKTGSLIWLRPVVKSPVADGKWFKLHVTVQGRRVQVRVDDQVVNEYVEPDNASVAPRLKRGTVAVRGHDGNGAVQIRNLQVRPLAGGAPAVSAPKMDATDLRITHLREQGFPLVDYDTHLRGGLTVEDVLAWSWKTGTGAGVTVNCGQGLPVADDKAAEAFLKRLRGRPAFVAMQAEGREWPRLFSPATVAKFDYVLADAMTITDDRGRRTRLWIKEEVEVPDPQAFTDRLVETIEKILDHEPIDIYANPTYLPEVIAKDYDRLWTPERMKHVVDALARNGVALEINARLHLPKPEMVKMAKRAGVKFAFGTNNDGSNLSRLEYCLRMIQECALTPDDLWAPKPDGQKPIQVRKRKE